MNKDCFANIDGRCGVLNNSKCSDKPCKFCKTATQLRIERQKSYNNLMEAGRLDVFDKYVIPKE